MEIFQHRRGMMDFLLINSKQNLTQNMIDRQANSNTCSKPTRKESLALWHRVILASVTQPGPDLSARQMAILMTIYLEDKAHTVRSLADKLKVTKAVMTRYGFVARGPDHRDKRSIIVKRTPGGITYLQGFADIIQTESQTQTLSLAA